MLFTKKKKVNPRLRDLDRMSEDMAQKISELKEMLDKTQSEPALQSGEEEGREGQLRPEGNTMPPLDRVVRVKQEERIQRAYTRGGVRNVRRDLYEGTVLLLVLIGSIAASTFWFIHLLEQS